MTVAEIEKKVSALRSEYGELEKERDALSVELSSLNEKLEQLRTAALRKHDSKAKTAWEALAQEIATKMTIAAGLAAEIRSMKEEVGCLLAQREQAARNEVFDRFAAEKDKALEQARELENAIDTLCAVALRHRDTLDKLRQLANLAGLERNIIDGRHLWRRLASRTHQILPFSVPKQGEEYSNGYTTILEHVLKHTEVAFARQNEQEQAKAS